MWWNKKKKYIYVLVRKDLQLVDQMVQVGHACFESGMKFGKKDTHLILFQVKNQEEINEWAKIIQKNKIQYSIFFEPDTIYDEDTEPMGNTAICTEPIHGIKRKIFKDCLLWT